MDAPGLSEHPHQDINEQELDFSDLFLCHHDDDLHGLLPNSHPPMLEVDCPSIRHYSSPPEPGQDPTAAHRTHQEPTADLHTHFISPGLSSRPSLIPAPSPRIEITPSGDSLSSHPHTQPQGPTALGVYRECSSPGSSNSSTGWPSENCSPLVSPCASPCNSGGYSLSALDLCPGLRAFHTSSTHSTPGGSPHSNVPYETFLLPHQPTVPTKLSQPHQRSRSLSPQGKRSYHQLHSCTGPTPAKQRSRSPSPSPVPSPNEPQRSHYLHQHHSPTPVLSGLLSGLNAAVMPSVGAQAAHRSAPRQDCVYGDRGKWQQPEKDVRAEVTPEAFYIIPNVWPAPTHHGAFSVSMAALPSLEWQLPSEVGQYKLQIQQQPRAFHRAHYETEGSRGAVKTASGGHPQVQLLGYHGSSSLRLQVFIGTADERQMKPHSFYQVHRVTGKTASSSRCEESTVYGTKVLEIPLEPKNNMRAMVDCVGILKLRNADIELRNGEIDIGRKNTRVRLVFRVHIPEPGGQLVSLQVCSQPIECSQRAQEMPSVESQDLDRCSVLGGQQMVLTGANFSPDSRVVFTEKTQDGVQNWEAVATVDRDKTQSNMLFVEVPPYRDGRVCSPVKVHFYVMNGKKNQSQLQPFTYTPLAIKAEPVDDYQVNYSYPESIAISGFSMKSLYHHHHDRSLQALGVSPTLYSHISTVNNRNPLDTSNHQHRSNPVLYHTQRYNTNAPVYQKTEHEDAIEPKPCSYQALLPSEKSLSSTFTRFAKHNSSIGVIKQTNSEISDHEKPVTGEMTLEDIAGAFMPFMEDEALVPEALVPEALVPEPVVPEPVVPEPVVPEPEVPEPVVPEPVVV